MTTAPSTTRPLQILHAPFAGSILDGASKWSMPLVVRFEATAITAGGRLITIDRSSVWIDDVFTSWHVHDLHGLGPDQMRAACELVESILHLRAGTLSAESLQPSLAVAAACVSGTISQLQRRLEPWHHLR